MLENVIIIAVLAVIVGGAVAYIIKAKKSGAKCIGCSVSGGCCSSDKTKTEEGCCCGCSDCTSGCSSK